MKVFSGCIAAALLVSLAGCSKSPQERCEDMYEQAMEAQKHQSRMHRRFNRGGSVSKEEGMRRCIADQERRG